MEYNFYQWGCYAMAITKSVIMDSTFGTGDGDDFFLGDGYLYVPYVAM